MSNPVRAANENREQELVRFLAIAGWGEAERSHLAGDASHRRYERLRGGDGQKAVLMDDPSDPFDVPLGDAPLGNDQKSYGEVAHLAKDCKAFAAIGLQLESEGLSVPQLLAHDFENGFLLLEDLGDRVYGPVIADDAVPLKCEARLYGQAVAALLHHHKAEQKDVLSLPERGAYAVPSYDAAALQIEADLLLDWYAPARLDKDLDESQRLAFREIWSELFPLLHCEKEVLILRDYHSPNLLELPEREGVRSVGIIDYQDGVMGHPAYDLMSLLQDARRDVPAELEARLLDGYLADRPDLVDQEFRTAYAILGAQRASKIIGIFCRLWKRDGKDTYLVHLPRMWAYLERNLEHPRLAAYKKWVDLNFPHASRDRA